MKLFEDGEIKRGALAAAVLLLAFLTACSGQTAPVSAPESDLQKSSTEAAVQKEPAEEESPLDQMDDGRLRALYRSEDNQSLVFHGAEIVYRGKGRAAVFEREDGSQFYSVSALDGEQYCYSLYNADGTLLLDDLSASPETVIGNWLFCVNPWYQEDSSGCAVNLDTMEQILLSCDSVPFVIGENYVGISSYAGESSFSVYRLSDLSLVEEFPDCWGYEESDLPGYISLHRYDMERGEDISFLYTPGSDALYDGFQRSCGKNQALLKTESGEYTVVNVSTGETLYTGPNQYDYYADQLKIWLSDGCTYISAPGYAEAEQIEYANFPWQNGDDCIDISRIDGGHDIFNRDGELLSTRTPEDGKSIYYMGYGYLTEQDSGWEENGVTLLAPDGSAVWYDRYNSLYWFQNIPDLVCGSYSVGNNYLIDLLDTDGNIVIEGINAYYTYAPDPAGILFVRKGFSYGVMDMEGNWLWKESIFQSASDEVEYYY